MALEVRTMEKIRSAGGNPNYKRILLKLSGEALKNSKLGTPISDHRLRKICYEIKEVHALGIEIGVVIGGGNIFRGLAGQDKGVNRNTGDYMGMLSTMINGLAIMDFLEKIDVEARIQTAIPMEKIGEPFILRRTIQHLEKGRIVIFVAGTGNPYFSTDTAAALRASEISADLLLKATDVDGIYDKDPKKDSKAKKFDEISYIDVLQKRLRVMDTAAFSLCLDNGIPILVLNMNKPGNIKKALMGEKLGTLVA
ncbi:MAG: Uridylate kinase [Candidatus Moanabacter tarae]|mgnify:CR=1 FL=1|uniref:Uridylate kinase n=1 Tax=Candidatus Moanibacter tarae TaxID=2200854 RepID=A0A2Z4AHE4_9BACT|nr:MAG: Uridylate kinase [Candidatus Moanabacter tarae]|tara:strand:+ start:50505 stop:51263 length:759 start_codon:yes stop_codon:yes gene_type:complete